MNNFRQIAWNTGIAALIALPWLSDSSYLQHLLVIWGIYCLFALSLNLVVGFLGELSFAHAAFFGVGAYASAILSKNLDWPLWLAMPTAVLAAAVCGALIGYVLLRVIGHQFAILSLAFGAVIYTITNYWVDFTNGPLGISNIAMPSVALWFDADSPARGYYYLVLLMLLLVIYYSVSLLASGTGRAFLAIRENLPLAQAVGVNPFRFRLIGFTTSAAIAGVAGTLYAHYVRVITPELMSLNYMVAAIIMVMIGGRGTILGPMIGAAIYVGLLELLRATGSLRMIVFSLLMTGCIVFLPGGLISLWARLRAARGGGDDERLKTPGAANG